MKTEKSEPRPSSFVDETLKATKRLADQRASLSIQAERLNRCIERFESWIAVIPGRVETSIHLPDPDPVPEDPFDIALVLRVARDGKQWPISFGWWEAGDDEAIGWKPLREASLDIKLYVIPKLPGLIVEMAIQQERLRSKIEEVAASFEEFASNVGMPKEGN